MSVSSWLRFLVLLLIPVSAVGQSARDPIPREEIARPTGSSRVARVQRSAVASTASTANAVRPKLVVVLVVDQFRRDYLTRFEADFESGGLRRLLREGAVFDGHYGQQNTYTGPGHALIMTGSYGYVNGIVQNKWWNRQSGRSESMLFNAGATLLSGKTTPDADTSPANLIGSTVGDELRLDSPSSKVVALALKERGAICLGGRLGQTYFQSDETGEMTSTTYYMSTLPDWVQTFNAGKPADAAFAKVWERLLPVARYPEADDYKLEADALGLGRTFPHQLTGKLDKPGPEFYTVFQQTPFGLELTFDFARAAIDGEQLGQRGVTDLLAVSISPTDLAGHAFGPYSQEVHDLVVRLDRAVAAFLVGLEQKFKSGELVVVFTADHGAVPIPEWSTDHGLQATRLKKAAIKQAVNQALSASFGPGEWVLALEDPSIYLDRALVASKKLDRAEVERVAGEAALELPGILTYYTRTQLLNGWLPPTEMSRVVAQSFSPTRSGDVVLVNAPFSFWGKYAEKDSGSTHGSPYRYDTEVPLIFWGRAFRAGAYGSAEMVDLAATLARVMRLTAPAACEGRVLVEALQ